jgi:hypothetical protein
MSYGAQIPISNNVDPTIGGWTTILNGLLCAKPCSPRLIKTA